MSKISITTSGSVAWRDHQRHRARLSVVQSFIREESGKSDVVCVTSTYSTVVLPDNNKNRGRRPLECQNESKASSQQPSKKEVIPSLSTQQQQQFCLSNPALRFSHDCVPTVSAYFYQRLKAPCQSNAKYSKVPDQYEVQDLSLWMPDEFEPNEGIPQNCNKRKYQTSNFYILSSH